MKQLKKTIKHVTAKIHSQMRLYIAPKRLQPMPLTLPAQRFLHPPMSVLYALAYAAQYHNRRSMMPGPVSKWA
jgi:hypothetical protein